MKSLGQSPHAKSALGRSPTRWNKTLTPHTNVLTPTSSHLFFHKRRATLFLPKRRWTCHMSDVPPWPLIVFGQVTGEEKRKCGQLAARSFFSISARRLRFHVTLMPQKCGSLRSALFLHICPSLRVPGVPGSRLSLIHLPLFKFWFSLAFSRHLPRKSRI